MFSTISNLVRPRRDKNVIAEESEPFLHDSESGHIEAYPDCPSYGSVNHADSKPAPPAIQDGESDSFEEDTSDSDDDDEDDDVRAYRANRLKETGGYLGYLRDFSIFVPFIFPRGNYTVYLCVLVHAILLIASRFLHYLIPRQLGIVTDEALAGNAPWRPLILWSFMSLLGGEAGVGFIQGLAKIPIQQASYKAITAAAFDHILTLSMDFHTEHDSAEVVKAVEQGNALVDVLESLVVEILPTLIDVVIAAWILTVKFNPMVTVTLVIFAIAIVGTETNLTHYNVKSHRITATAERREARVMYQSVQGWETVAFFGAAALQQRILGRAVQSKLTAERRREVLEASTQAILTVLADVTLFCLCALVLLEISRGRNTPGDFVFLLYYWDYLMWPLKFLAQDYRHLLSNLVSAERLLSLLRTKSTITDLPGAMDLHRTRVSGRVAFENVTFGYEPAKPPTIRNLSLTAMPGQTIAVVGETGAGKSSLIRLLLRLYDPGSGRILLDGLNICNDLTLSSLRRAIGVVPQHPFLFNTTILDNVRFANPTATEDDVRAACRSAAIDQRISTMRDGYNTLVGERGIKLSGGEAQRIALARAFLADPPVLVLDEATSAVDNVTESNIQEALDRLRVGRTTFVIAHRLSTVVKADCIIVLHEGRIVEQGTHQELLDNGGRYLQMWGK
ncbi:P-loop containing nucleoside triphosphate hydrolase protein [Plectosphaerella plurivora]|uniref:P-loop containing nucleoside triphosphate hydrolase protein n=1 Tax=Plectosphaerella plurivora TaxID=936078 RepID=A0A9P8VGM3_9PEZI|nr:P-loop containing nucleoside triphosphate hydrolase protein [Plectosphaerella plurivora]